MSSYDYRRLLEQLGGMDAWKNIAVGAVCAKKTAPIIRTLALPDTWRLANRCIQFVWQAITDSQPNCEEAEDLLNELNSVAEWQMEYPDTVLFSVLHPLDLVRFPLSMITAKSPKEMLDQCGFSHVLDVADEFDASISDYPEFVSALEITDMEQGSQISIVNQLAQFDSPEPACLEMLEREAQSISELIKTALPVHCYSFVSGLCSRG